MPDGQIESINFDGVSARVFRTLGSDLSISLEPPEATPYVTAGKDTAPDDIVSFVNERLPTIREMRQEMIKRYGETPVRECRYQTGDVAYVLGRPFMLRVYPTSPGRQLRHAARGRANTGAKVHADVSLIELFVVQTGNYDQRRLAFLSWANGVLANNVEEIVRQAQEAAEIVGRVPSKVQVRAMHTGLFRFDETRGTIWASDALVPYPPVCVAYAFMREAARHVIPAGDTDAERDAAAEQRKALIAKGCPGWVRAKAILEAEDSPYKRQ